MPPPVIVSSASSSLAAMRRLLRGRRQLKVVSTVLQPDTSDTDSGWHTPLASPITIACSRCGLLKAGHPGPMGNTRYLPLAPTDRWDVGGPTMRLIKFNL